MGDALIASNATSVARCGARVFNQTRAARDATLALIPLVAVISKILQLRFLPAYFFFDAEKILADSFTSDFASIEGGQAFEITARIFYAANPGFLLTVADWSIFLALIFNPILIYMVWRYQKLSPIDGIFILCGVALLNIYVFTLSKESIQFVFVIAMFFTLQHRDFSKGLKFAICFVLLLLVALCFRSYYLITLGIFTTLYVLSSSKGFTRSLQSSLWLITASLLCYFVLLLVVSVTHLDGSNILITVRDIVTSSLRASGVSSIIGNPFYTTDSVVIALVNYVICALRMLLPLELVLGKIYYLPYIFFQIMFTVLFFVKARHLCDLPTSRRLAFFFLWAFCMTSFIFEPDFGSWCRHEIAMFPIMILFLVDGSGICRYDKLSGLVSIPKD